MIDVCDIQVMKPMLAAHGFHGGDNAVVHRDSYLDHTAEVHGAGGG